MNIRNDFMGKVPYIGDVIVFNPPRYKGLVKGVCVGFQESGLPKVAEIDSGDYWLKKDLERLGYYVPKTGFISIRT